MSDFIFPPQASTFAADIDNLIIMVAGFVGFWFFVAQGVFFWSIFKFRDRGDGRRGRYISGELASEMRYISVPHMLVLVCDVFILIGAVRVWYLIKQTLPKPEATIRVIGQQWAWTYVDPGLDGKLGTDDDIRTVDELHIKVDTMYQYRLTSKDVIHSFSIPVFRLKHDAIPGREIVGWFKATKTGVYDIQCNEICGIGHGIMMSRLYIETPQEHDAWLKQQTAARAAK